MIAQRFQDLEVWQKAHQLVLEVYHTALASLDESEYHLLLAHDLGYANTECCRDRLTEVARMLNAYIRAITTSQKPRNDQS